MKSIRQCLSNGFLFLSILLAGCQPDLPAVLKPAGAARFKRFTPTTSATPAATLTATPITIAQPGTPFPTPGAPISIRNAQNIEEIASRGMGKAQAVGWSVDGKALAVASTRGLYLYDAQTLQIIEVLDSALYRSLAFSPDGKYLAAGSDDGIVRLWRMKERRLLAALDGHDAAILNLAFSASGGLLASGSWDNITCIWRISDSISSQDVPRFNIDITPANGVQALGFSDDESEIFTWSPPGEVWILNLDNGETRSLYVGRIKKGAAPSLEFSAGSQMIAIENDDQVQLYQGSNGYTLRSLSGFDEAVQVMAFSRDNEYLATAANRQIDVWQVKNGSLAGSYTLDEPQAFIRSMAFSHSSDRLAVLGDRLHVIDLSAPDARWTSAAMPYPVQNLLFMQFLPDGRHLASGWTDGSFSITDLESGELLQQIQAHFDSQTAVSSLALAPDGSLGATGNWDNRFILWAQSGSTIEILQELEVDGAVTCAVFSDDSSLLAGATQPGEILLWRLPQAEPLARFDAGDMAQTLLLSPDKRFVAAHTRQGILLWKLADISADSGAEPLLITPGSHAAFSPDSRFLAIAQSDSGRRQVMLYDCDSGEAAAVIDTAVEGVLQFSTDGAVLALSSLELTLWNTGDGSLLARRFSRAPYGRLAFSPDGRLLLLAAGDGAFQIFGIP